MMMTYENAKYHGVMDRQARFVEAGQLLNQEDWLLFVKQFQRGVDDGDLGWRGEYFGKMMRGACMTYQYTKNEELYDLLYAVVEDMLKTQDEHGRFSTYSLECEFQGWDMWCRKYVLLGLLHFYEICQDKVMNARIMEALERHLDYIVAHVGEDPSEAPNGRISLGQTTHWWKGINSASILEPVVKLYKMTGKESYLSFAQYIINFLMTGEANIFALALEDELMPYQYPVVKAYEMMSCFEGLLEYYSVTGEEKWKTAVINFVDRMYQSDISLIGCAGCKHEQLNHSVETQTDTDYKGAMQETCVTVTWMKLCNRVLMLTGEAKYADYIERSFYNALYGAVNHNGCTTNGGFMFDSYSPLTAGVRGRQIGGHKDIAPDKYYGCCAAIGACGTALPLVTAVVEDNRGIVVNYYEDGTVKLNGLTLNIQTAYPTDGRVRIELSEAESSESSSSESSSSEKTILLRIPDFAVRGSEIRVNGELWPYEYKGTEGIYVSINRVWKQGDVIELVLNMNARMIRPCGMKEKPATKDFFAVLYGPLVLARDARVTEVGTRVTIGADEDGIQDITVYGETVCDFNCIFQAKVQIGDHVLSMIDYASAGKTWDEASRMEAWIHC